MKEYENKSKWEIMKWNGENRNGESHGSQR